jgi:hydroxymethylpyrimidine pyrophosphatase-like HAD family hydrolase
MRYHVLATDYDGTLAHEGAVAPEMLAALARVRGSGRKLLLVTGREVDDLLRVFPDVAAFDLVVAENGAVIYNPSTRQTRTLAEPPPAAFVDQLQQRGVAPISVGHVIVATWQPHETVALDVIRTMGLELQVIFNKGAVMILPSGINKAVGLQGALDELQLSAHNTVGVGDAENDHAFLAMSECAVAVPSPR